MPSLNCHWAQQYLCPWTGKTLRWTSEILHLESTALMYAAHRQARNTSTSPAKLPSHGTRLGQRYTSHLAVLPCPLLPSQVSVPAAHALNPAGKGSGSMEGRAVARTENRVKAKLKISCGMPCRMMEPGCMVPAGIRCGEWVAHLGLEERKFLRLTKLYLKLVCC